MQTAVHGSRHSGLYLELKRCLRASTGARTGVVDDWCLDTGVYDTVMNQLANYRQLPTLDTAINQKLAQIQHLYDLDEGDDTSKYIEGYLRRVSPDLVNRNKLVRLKAHILKHEIHGEYMNVLKMRKDKLSVITQPEVSKETIVSTYTTLNMIKFVKLLYDDTFLNGSYMKYYQRFVYLFNQVSADYSYVTNGGFIRKLRPVDLEKMIKVLIYSNKHLSSAERKLLNIPSLNNYLLSKMQECELKMTTKELFSILRLSSSFDKTDENINGIEELYNKFSKSDKFVKDGDFFKNFLNMNFTLGYQNRKIVSIPFTEKVVTDIIHSDLEPDRHMLKYLLKFSWLSHNLGMARVVVQHLFKNYAVDTETFNMVWTAVCNIDTNRDTQMLQQLNSIYKESEHVAEMLHLPNKGVSEEDRFQVRLYDHLCSKDTHTAGNASTTATVTATASTSTPSSTAPISTPSSQPCPGVQFVAPGRNSYPRTCRI